MTNNKNKKHPWRKPFSSKRLTELKEKNDLYYDDDLDFVLPIESDEDIIERFTCVKKTTIEEEVYD